jgi:beta-glucosidase
LAPGAFPTDFVWGAATAAYQIEGAAQADGRSESIWDRFSHTPGKVVNGDTGDVACDHYARWRDDLRLLQELHLNAYRLSLAWPRILPLGRGQPNPAGLAFYDRLVDALLEAGITPWVTLYHWDLPQVLEDAGGWPNRATADAFAEFADVASRRLGDRVKRWITLNEPWCSAYLGYALGVHAPGRASFRDSLAAAHTLLLAHGQAVPIIRRNSPGAEVGITLNLAQVYPASDSEADRAAARRWDGFQNRWYLDPLYGRGYPADLWEHLGSDLVPAVQEGDLGAIAQPTDFLGLNYYAPTFVRDDPGNRPLAAGDVGLPGAEVTEMDWVVYPKGLYDLLKNVARAYPTGPLYITENGAAYPDPAPENGRVADPNRQRYYARHLEVAQQAIAEGVPLKGYFAWSLLDNFEWAFGYTRRFGLTYVDFTTQQRTLKDSGRWYGRVVAANRLATVGA